MSIMASYLTGAWELSITHAAAIVNLYSGVVGIMPVGMICIVYMTGYMGSYWMILLSRFAYTAVSFKFSFHLKPQTLKDPKFTNE